MTAPASSLVHATAVAVAGRGVLVLGASGAGKSDLALRLITTPLLDRGQPVEIRLVSDDQVVIERVENRLFASAPPVIAGQLEVRGIGILPFPNLPRAEVRLIVMLKPSDRIERLPAASRAYSLLGVDVPLVEVDGTKPGAPARLVLAALHHAKI